MPDQINLRQAKGSTLTIAEADQSLQHLSQCEVVAVGQQLYTGGDYVVTAAVSCPLPTDGNRFAMTVQSGSVTLTGATVEGVSNKVFQPSGRQLFAKLGNDWKVVSRPSASASFKSVSDNTTVDLANPMLWVDSSVADRTVTIPAGFADGSTFAVVRDGDFDVFVTATGASEGIVNPDNGTLIKSPDNLEINRQNSIVWFSKEGNDWRFAKA